MVDLSAKTAQRLLRLMTDKVNIVGSRDNAGFVELQRRGHATAEAIYDAGGRLAISKLWKITPAGTAWLEQRG